MSHLCYIKKKVSYQYTGCVAFTRSIFVLILAVAKKTSSCVLIRTILGENLESMSIWCNSDIHKITSTTVERTLNWVRHWLTWPKYMHKKCRFTHTNTENDAMYTDTHTHTHTQLHTYTRTDLCTQNRDKTHATLLYIHAATYIHTNIHTHTNTHTHTHTTHTHMQHINTYNEIYFDFQWNVPNASHVHRNAVTNVRLNLCNH